MERGVLADLVALLPEDILADILRRLATPRSLAVSRSVCQTFRAIVDRESLLHTELPFTGIFMNFDVLRLPEFFSRPSSSGQHEVSGKLDFMPSHIDPSRDRYGDKGYYIWDHCNGLLLLNTYEDYLSGGDTYVVNPATRRWDLLPPHKLDQRTGIVRCIFDYKCYVAFDPRVSSHYHVFQIPYLWDVSSYPEEELDPMEEASEWPPSIYILHVFSSRTRRWEKRSFVRQGDSARTVAKARVYSKQLHAVYCRGALYVHCQTDFVIRISCSEDSYSVIEPPVDVGSDTYLGLSEKGVYFASFVKGHIRVCILNESCDQAEWMLKHDYDLKPVKSFDRQVIHGPWILEDINYNSCHDCLPEVSNKATTIQEKLGWDSDNEEFHDNEGLVEAHRHQYLQISILGFHPYKEIMFLCRTENCNPKATGFAYHLNSFRVERLGTIDPTDYDHFDCGLFDELDIKSFPYTPCCWIKDIPETAN